MHIKTFESKYLLTMALFASGVMVGQSTQTPSPALLRRGFVPVLKFVIHYRSIEPQQITVVEGSYDLRVNGGLLQGNLTYQLQDDAKSQSNEKNGEPGKSHQVLQVDLKPGRYLLTVKGAGDRWKSVIVVTKK